MVTVYELIKREDGSVAGIGSSVEVEEAEANELVAAGTHKFIDKPLGDAPKAVVEVDEEEKVDGEDSNS